MVLKKRIVRCGRSRNVLNIPQDLAEILNLTEGREVHLIIRGTSLVITPIIIKEQNKDTKAVEVSEDIPPESDQEDTPIMGA